MPPLPSPTEASSSAGELSSIAADLLGKTKRKLKQKEKVVTVTSGSSKMDFFGGGSEYEDEESVESEEDVE